MALDILAHTYQQAADIQIEQAQLLVAAALDRARAKHPDFNRFLAGVEFLSSVCFTDHQRMPLDDYLETLYCAARHSDFAKPWRVSLRGHRPLAK